MTERPVDKSLHAGGEVVFAEEICTVHLPLQEGIQAQNRRAPISGAWELLGYVKADVSEAGDRLGTAVAVSADGATVAASAPGDDASLRDPTDNMRSDSGAAWTWR